MPGVQVTDVGDGTEGANSSLFTGDIEFINAAASILPPALTWRVTAEKRVGQRNGQSRMRTALLRAENKRVGCKDEGEVSDRKRRLHLRRMIKLRKGSKKEQQTAWEFFLQGSGKGEVCFDATRILGK
jgi:hypothetical protein